MIQRTVTEKHLNKKGAKTVAVALGLAGGLIALLSLMAAMKNLMAEKHSYFALFFFANALAVGATLLGCALWQPKKLGWCGAAMAVVLIAGGFINIGIQQWKGRKKPATDNEDHAPDG
jgi:hypothetical protein